MPPLRRQAHGAGGLAVREINVTERPETVAELMKLTGGRRLVPVVVEDGRVAVAPDGGSSF